MHTPEEIAHLRTELIGHLQAASELVQKTGDNAVGYFLELALQDLRGATLLKDDGPNAKPPK